MHSLSPCHANQLRQASGVVHRTNHRFGRNCTQSHRLAGTALRQHAAHTIVKAVAETLESQENKDLVSALFISNPNY